MTPDRNALFTEISKLVAEHALESEASYGDDTRIDALGIDSIDLMEIIFRLEEAHGVVISPLGLKWRETLGAVVDYAHETLSA